MYKNENIQMRGKFVEQSIGKLQAIGECIPEKVKNGGLPLSEASSRTALRTKLPKHKRGIFR